MLELFAPLKELLYAESLRIDNLGFRLHCRLTVLLLTICAILVTAQQLVGVPISCITDREGLDIYGEFLVVKLQLLESEMRHRKTRLFTIGTINGFVSVCIVLILQATMFYAPRALWQVWEGGLVNFLTQDLVSPFSRETWTNEQRKRFLSYFADNLSRGHNIYALRFFVCEVLNFFNTLSQVYFLNLLLDGQFAQYGPSVIGLTSETSPFERIDPMARLFPKLTKCTIHTFGPGGSSQTHDALCVLPLNVVNEKIFVFLWFWLVFLVIVGIISLAYRITVLSQPWARIILLRASVPGLSRLTALRLVRNLTFGDWFLVRQLTKNTNPLILRQLIQDLASDYPKLEVYHGFEFNLSRDHDAQNTSTAFKSLPGTSFSYIVDNP